MIFKTMKKEEVLKILKGQENIIDKAVQDNAAFFKLLSCVSCGGEVMPTVNPRQLFKEGSILPNYLGKCKICGVLFEPHTGIQITMPDPSL
jgi:hypothetical protein